MNKRIRTLIVDDERLARRRLLRLLSQDPQIEVIGCCENAAAALNKISADAPDLLFLDIQMPGMNGFELLDAVETPPAAVIFVTAHDDYALQAFEVHALDYLLKPYDDERFASAVERAKKHLLLGEPGQFQRILSLLADMRTSARAERILVKVQGKEILLRAEDVDWVAADGKYVRIHSGGRSYVLRETLNEFEARLDDTKFVRVHRSTIVNIDRIKELWPMFHGDYEIVLLNGVRLPLSRRFRGRLKALSARSSG